MDSRPLMIDIQFQEIREKGPGLLELLQAKVTKAHHIETVYLVSPVQVVLEYQEIRQRNGEIVYGHIVIQVLLSVIDQLVETASGFLCIPQLEPCQSLIEDHIWWLIVVKHCAGRLFVSL